MDGRLLEREDEITLLKGHLARAAGGSGSLVFVEGPAGLGKTSLLSEVSRIAEPMGFLVRRARGSEMERDMPYGVVRQLFESLVERASREQRDMWFSGAAGRALPALGRSDAAEESNDGDDAFGSINGLYWLTSNLAESEPLLLVVDDAHWSDAESLRFISFLSRRVSELPVLVTVAARIGEPQEPEQLPSIRSEGERMQLAPLRPPSVGELIAIRTGRTPTPRFSEVCADVCSGNPFFVTELLRELEAEGLQPDDSAAEVVGDIGPVSVGDAVLARLGTFGPDAVALAKAVAVLGGGAQPRHASMMTGIDEGKVADLGDRLREAEILRRGVPLDFQHPLVRQAVYGELADAERSTAHRRAAEILARTGSTPRDVAPHLLACAPDGDQWVVETLVEAAGDATRAGTSASAATMLQRALEEPPTDKAAISHLLGRALQPLDPFRASTVLSEAADLARDDAQRRDILIDLVFALVSSGDWGRAVEACDTVLRSLDDRADRELRLALEAQRYIAKVNARGIDASDSERIEAIATGLTGSTAAERGARQALACDRFVRCHPVTEVLEIIFPFPELPWDTKATLVAVGAVKVLAWTGRFDEAREAAGGWIESSHRLGRPGGVSLGNSLLSEIDRLAGRLAQAEAEARTAFDIAEPLGPSTIFGWSAWMNLAAILLARGDLEGFAALAGDSDLSAGPTEVPINPWPLELRAQAHLARGELEAGVADMLALGDSVERWGVVNPAYPPWRQEATSALGLLGRTAEAKELIGVAEQRAAAFGAPHVMGSVLRARAAIEPRKQAVDTLEQSAEILEGADQPHELARSLIELGTALRADGRRAEARQPLFRALELCVRSGAGGLERRARDELAAVGARPRRVARTGVPSLTGAELRVASLAAEGFNNREIAERLFIARRTVETHLTHVYEKLGIEGRRELRSVLEEAGQKTP